MELKDLVRALRRRWGRIAILAICGLALGTAAAFLLPRTYESTARIFVEPQVSTAGTASSAPEVQAKSYAALASSDVLVRQVIDELGLDATPGEFLRAASVVVEPDTAIILVSVRDRSATDARTVAQTLTETFVRYLTLIDAGREVTPENLADEDADGDAPATIVQPADEPGPPASPSTPLLVGGGLVLGLLLGAAWAVASELRRRRVRDVADVTRFDDRTTVLGTVPARLDAPDVQVSPATDDACRRVAAALESLTGANDAPVVLVTPVHDTSVAVLAAQLARATSTAGRRTLLIDADQDDDRLTQLLGLVGTPGLGDAPSPVDATAVRLSPTLQVVPSGGPGAGRAATTTALAASLRAGVVGHDLVLVVAPPLALDADGVVLGRAADLVVAVAEQDVTLASELSGTVDAALAVGMDAPTTLLVTAPSGRARPAEDRVTSARRGDRARRRK